MMKRHYVPAGVAAILGAALLSGCQLFQAARPVTPPEIQRLAPGTPFAATEEMGKIANAVAGEISGNHYLRLAIDDSLSQKVFDKFLQTLDPSRILFTQEDLVRLEPYRTKVDDELLGGKMEFPFVAGEIAARRANELLAFAREMLKDSGSFATGGELVRDRKHAAAPKDEAEQRRLWSLIVRNELVMVHVENRAAKAGIKSPTGKTISQFIAAQPAEKRVMTHLEQLVYDIRRATADDLAERYLAALTLCCDPHCMYNSPAHFARMQSMISLSFAGIGLAYNVSNGYCEVDVVTPNGPVAKQGADIKPGDIILSAAEEGKEPVSLVGIAMDKISDYLRGKAGTKVTLEVLDGSKPGAPSRKVTIVRGQVRTDSQKASGEIREVVAADGKHLRVGVVTLPIFYNVPGPFGLPGKGAGDDIRDILADFEKKGGVDGVILDLRSNPGGLLPEAIKVAGLFIKTGPVVQVRSPERTQILPDTDPSVAYSGPLIVMINKMSASASEIVSGALKDYRRAVIVGDTQTYGKGTVQSVMPLGQLAWKYGLPQNPGGLNLTIQKFYRVNGDSTQFRGVAADIVLPAFSDVMKDLGEAKQDYAIPFDSVKPANHDLTNPEIDALIPALRAESEKRVEADPGFKKLKPMIAEYDRLSNSPTISLDEKVRWNEYLETNEIARQQVSLLKVDAMRGAKPEENAAPEKDLYLDEALRIMGDFVTAEKKGN